MKLYVVDRSSDPFSFNELIRDNTDPGGECHISDDEVKRISALEIGETTPCGIVKIKRVDPALWEDPAYQGEKA